MQSNGIILEQSCQLIETNPLSPGGGETKFIISTFNGRSEAQTQIVENEETVGFDELKKVICLRSWSPSTFQYVKDFSTKKGKKITGRYRSKDTFKSTSFLVYDIDGGLLLAEALDKCIQLGITFFIGITRNHQKPKKDNPACDRYRIVILLSRQINTNEEYALIWNFHAKTFGVDEQCKDSSRFYFPCKEIVAGGSGISLDVDQIVKQSVLLHSEANLMNTNESARDSGQYGQLSRSTLDFIANGRKMDESWHGRFFKAATDLREQGYSIDEARCKLTFAANDELGLLDKTDENQLADIYARENRYPPRKQNCVGGGGMEEPSEKRKSQAELLLSLCSDIELFHNSEGEQFATVPVQGHQETWPLMSEGFKNWVRGRYFQKTASAPSAQSMQDSLATLGAKAQFEGEEINVHLRIARVENKIFIDLCDGDWRVVEISGEGWRVVSNSPVKFRRAKGMLALPEPIVQKPKDIIAIFMGHLNLDAESDFMLVTAWIVSAFNSDKPFPILVLYAEQGSGKSTFVKMLRSVVDPNVAALRREPRNSDDLLVSAKSNWIIAIDNISHLADWLSDDFCRLATGGGLSKRAHYTNDEEFVLNAKRPIIINGIEEFVTRGDLADRSIVLSLPSISESKRKTEEELFRQFNCDKPRLFGAILAAIAEGLKNQGGVKLDRLPRMADAIHWATATETAFGWKPGSIAAAFERNQDKANEIVLSSSPLYPLIRELAHYGWSGTAGGLLDYLKQRNIYNKYIPVTPRSLSDKIRRIRPALRTAGIEVVFEQTSGTNSMRMIRFNKLASFFDAKDATDATAGTCGTNCDGSVNSDAERQASTLLIGSESLSSNIKNQSSQESSFGSFPLPTEFKNHSIANTELE